MTSITDNVLKDKLEYSFSGKTPSLQWVRNYDLLNGFGNLIENPFLKDGAKLSPHQVEVLESTKLEIESGEKRLWFEHATGSGKSVSAVAFIAATKYSNILILTHRTNLVEQFQREITSRGYGDRLRSYDNIDKEAFGQVTVETYQWFVRNSENIEDIYSLIICDEAHTALGPQTSKKIKAWQGPIFIGMTATGALLERHVSDLFPKKTHSFNLLEAARKEVISPLKVIRIAPSQEVSNLAKVPLRRGEVDVDFDQNELAKTLNQLPFNLAVSDLYKSEFKDFPAVIYTAGVNHAKDLTQTLKDIDVRAACVSGETPKKELEKILQDFEDGKIDVLCNAMLLIEGWNSKRASLCMNLAPTASRRIYQQRVGRVTRLGKPFALVIDFVHPATRHDSNIITLHGLLNRPIYRRGATCVGKNAFSPLIEVDSLSLPVSGDKKEREEMIKKNLWRIDSKCLYYDDALCWTEEAARRVRPKEFKKTLNRVPKEVQSQFLLLSLNHEDVHVRMEALEEIFKNTDFQTISSAVTQVLDWQEFSKAGIKKCLQLISSNRIGTKEEAIGLMWKLAESQKKVYEKYLLVKKPELKRLLGSFVSSNGPSHCKQAKRLCFQADKEELKIGLALLASACAHSKEAEEIITEKRKDLSQSLSKASRLLSYPLDKKKKSRKNSDSEKKREKITDITGEGTEKKRENLVANTDKAVAKKK